MTKIPEWKFDLIRGHIRDILKAGPQPYEAVKEEVGQRLTKDESERLGKLGWHVITVKLELEVRNEVARIHGKTPQQIRWVE